MLIAAAIYSLRFFFPHVVVAPSSIVKPNDTHNKSLSFEDALKAENIEYTSLSYASQSSTLIVTFPDKSYAYFDTGLSPTGQAKLLEKILSRMRIEKPHAKLKYIDLRFEKAVVKF